jgi:hypothetical protein
MRKIFLSIFAIATVCSFSSCKKAIEAAQEQIVVNAITDGVWYISKFTEGGTDITTSFAGWEFTFYSNGTSAGNKTGNATVTGTWSGDTNTLSFTTAYTTTPPAPLPKTAGVWLVTRAVSTTKGSYARTTGGITYEMEMTKK